MPTVAPIWNWTKLARGEVIRQQISLSGAQKYFIPTLYFLIWLHTSVCSFLEVDFLRCSKIVTIYLHKNHRYDLWIIWLNGHFFFNMWNNMSHRQHAARHKPHTFKQNIKIVSLILLAFTSPWFRSLFSAQTIRPSVFPFYTLPKGKHSAGRWTKWQKKKN